MPTGEVHKRKTQCPKGHPYDEANTYWTTNRHGNIGRCCRECQKERMQRKRGNPEFKANEAEKMRRWREANPKQNRENCRRVYERRNRWIQSFKVKCKYCPEARFPCLDFHHRESGEKAATIALVRHWSRSRLLEEIEKCDVVCANCHRWLHWEEKHSLDKRET